MSEIQQAGRKWEHFNLRSSRIRRNFKREEFEKGDEHLVNIDKYLRDMGDQGNSKETIIFCELCKLNSLRIMVVEAKGEQL